jgi:putative flippase GtrA
MTTSIMHLTPPTARLRSVVQQAAPRLVRFACTGLLAGAIQLALLHLWTARGWDALVANPVAFLVSAQLNFLLSVTFIWRNRRDAPRRVETLRRRWIAFHCSILSTALLNQAVFGMAQVALPSLLAAALGIAAGALVNFLVQDRFVFATRRQIGP